MLKAQVHIVKNPHDSLPLWTSPLDEHLCGQVHTIVHPCGQVHMVFRVPHKGAFPLMRTFVWTSQ